MEKIPELPPVVVKIKSDEKPPKPTKKKKTSKSNGKFDKKVKSKKSPRKEEMKEEIFLPPPITDRTDLDEDQIDTARELIDKSPK